MLDQGVVNWVSSSSIRLMHTPKRRKTRAEQKRCTACGAVDCAVGLYSPATATMNPARPCVSRASPTGWVGAPTGRVFVPSGLVARTPPSLDTVLPNVVSLRLQARVTSTNADLAAFIGEAATLGCEVARCCKAEVDDAAAAAGLFSGFSKGVGFFAPFLGDGARFPATGRAGADFADFIAALTGDAVLSGWAEVGRELTGDWLGPTWECACSRCCTAEPGRELGRESPHLSTTRAPATGETRGGVWGIGGAARCFGGGESGAPPATLPCLASATLAAADLPPKPPLGLGGAA
eukprot:scaffold81704_cov66-Phaeocystis_antarctica.AAC.2